MPRISQVLDLSELPVPSMLCKAFNQLDMAVWRVLLTLSATQFPTNGVVGVDESGFDRSDDAVVPRNSDVTTDTFPFPGRMVLQETIYNRYNLEW